MISDLFWLTDERMERLRPFLRKSRSRPRLDDRRMQRGIVFVNRNGLRWRDAPSDYSPHRTLYSRCPTAFFSAVTVAATVILWM